MNLSKRQLHHIFKKLRPISPWYFLVLGIISAVISINAMRNNNITMVRLRGEVFKADQENGDIETALRDLRKYIYSHMNTNLNSGNNTVKPPIQLKYRYERLVAAEKARVSATNEQIYTQAQTECERLFPHGISGGGRVPCIQDYVSTRGTKEQPIEDSLYKFDFVSPTWTPDLAGWTMVASVMFFSLFAIRFGLERWLKAELHDHL